MAHPILGTPKPVFLDSSGSPLVSGTLTIQDPDDSSAKAVYPTAADADASTNGSTAAVTLDARGEPTNQLWGRDGEDYKVILKDSSGNTIYTLDEIRLPGHVGRATVTFSSGDGTPSVAESNLFICAGTTAITDFDDGEVGDVIMITGPTVGGTEIVITNNSNIYLAGNQNFTMGNDDVLVLAMFEDQVWQEVARKTRSGGEVKAITSAETVLASENNTVYMFNSTTGILATLPSPAEGLKYEFYVKTAATSGNHRVYTGGPNIFYGFLMDINATTPTYAVSAQDRINFIASTALPGDYCRVESDGTNWFVFGYSSADGGITADTT